MDKYQPTDFKWRHFHGEVIVYKIQGWVALFQLALMTSS